MSVFPFICPVAARGSSKAVLRRAMRIIGCITTREPHKACLAVLDKTVFYRHIYLHSILMVL